MKTKKLYKNNRAMSDIFGILFMVTISIVAAGAINYTMSGTIRQTEGTPFVSMIQTDNYISIIDISNGEIEATDASTRIEDSSKNTENLDATIEHSGVLLRGGDRIEISGTGLKNGERYTVYLIYKSNIVGQADFTYHE